MNKQTSKEVNKQTSPSPLSSKWLLFKRFLTTFVCAFLIFHKLATCVIHCVLPLTSQTIPVFFNV